MHGGGTVLVNGLVVSVSHGAQVTVGTGGQVGQVHDWVVHIVVVNVGQFIAVVVVCVPAFA